MAADPKPTPRLSITNASKTFGRVRVLDSVAIKVFPGEIHGLVGQNGSGKSTLIKLLSGFHSADEGTRISIDGVPLRMPVSPHELQARGLAFVHQDLGLDLDANVIENIRIGRFAATRVTRRIRWQSEAQSVASALAALGPNSINPHAAVRSLDHAERASVAIARALQGIELGTGLIVFDESTQSLPRDILREFYAKARAIASSGTSVLIVSHRLDEVLALCDRVTVLEDGSATVQGESTKGLTEAGLTRLILGRSAAAHDGSETIRTESARREQRALVATDVTGHGLNGASLALHAGEVVGVIGASESGYDILPYVLAGTMRATGGTVQIAETEVTARSLTPSAAINLGLCLVPGNRAAQGVSTDMTALENLTLPRVTTKGRSFALRRRWQLSEFMDAVISLGVTPRNPDLPVMAFSGGNQQKILLAKWLLNKPRVLVLHEPTQAVDVGARRDILRELRRQAAKGVAVLVSSLEAADLANACDRVIVMKEGRVDRELSGDELDSHTIIDAAYTGISSEIAHVTH